MFFKKNKIETYAKQEGDKALGGLVNKTTKILPWSIGQEPTLEIDFETNRNNPLPGTLGEGKKLCTKR